MEQSPRLSLSYVMPAQAQKHVTVNETFRRLDALTQLSVLSRATAAEPGAPAEGDAYILPASPTGAAWDAYSGNNIAVFQDGAWIEIAALEGLRAWIGDESALAAYDGAAWTVVTGGGGSETAAKFGVNATADATNKLSVKSNAVLFDALDAGEGGTGDSQVKVNKEAAGDTASHIFQTAFSGRAEFGLLGDDSFRIKVSPDNFATSYDALVIDKDNGNVGIGAAAPAEAFHVVGSNIRMDRYGGNPGFQWRMANGSESSPTATLANDRLGAFLARGYHNSGNFGGNSAAIFVEAEENFTSSAQGTRWTFETASPGSSSRTERMRLAQGLQIGAPAGGDKGSGTLNA